MAGLKDSASWIVEMSPIPKSKAIIQSEATSCKKYQNQDSGIKECDQQFYIDLSRPSVGVTLSQNISNFVSTLNSTTHNNSWKSSEFEDIEALCNDSTINIMEITHILKKESIDNEDKASQETIPVQNSYVKLSDLDNPVSQSDFKYDDTRMTRSIPEKSLVLDQPTSGSVTLHSSFYSDNALSLNRLFPNLKNALSKSMSGSLSGRTGSPLRLEVFPSPAETDNANLMSIDSELSSHSIHSTSDETSYMASLISNCSSRLGQDLLCMFLEEIATDVIVEVAGKRIKAHKCILSSRCQYFARMLSGGFVESAGNVITLPSLSFEVIHFVLCHIYSGTLELPDTIPIIELAATTDMLGLEGLKELIMYKLKSSYCHNFHMPCAICVEGVVECFSLSSLYGLADLYLKCLKWITKHFTKVWVTKAFSALPKELLEKCYTEHDVNLSLDNFIDTVYGCGIVVGTLEKSRWADKVIKMCQRLLNSAAHFAAPKLVKVLELIATIHMNLDPRGKQTLNSCITVAIQWSPPQETCRTYAFLSNYIKETEPQHEKLDPISNVKHKYTDTNNLLYTNAPMWRLQCENSLVRATPRVVNTKEFKDLPTDLRSRLSGLGCIVFEVPPSSPSISLEEMKPAAVTKQDPANLDVLRRVALEHVRNSFIPYKLKPVTMNPKLRPEREKKKSPPIVRTTKAQDQRTKFNLSKANAESLKPLPRPLSTKSAHLKPEQSKDAKTSQLISKVVSSSQISRMSPLLMRNAKASSIKTMSQDSLAWFARPRTAEPTTDSLIKSQSNKFGTYTKAKKAFKGSAESMRSSQQSSSINSKDQKSKIPRLIRKPDNIQKTKQPRSQLNPPTKTMESTKRTNSLVSTIPAQVPKPKLKLKSTLLSATVSSAAKMATKIEKEPFQTKKPPNKPKEAPKALLRSATFIKDKPT